MAPAKTNFMNQYTPIIGMEIHIELGTLSKMFCGCPADHFAKSPNTQTCPVCLGLPGALPVPNRLAVTWTQMVGLALQCRLNPNSKFDRKHYFYPDLPKGYQISQYDEPLCSEGELSLNTGKIRITRVHLEEDTGKLQHVKLHGKPVSLVDFNRSGVPLVEIVSEPDIRSSAQAKEYCRQIRKMVNFLGVSDCDMEKGSMRLEANISLQKAGVSGLPAYKVEVKNINSFRFLEKAINFEVDRQAKLLDRGLTPAQETRGFSEANMETVSQRSKEAAKDYRYFPEPDIPPLTFSPKDLSKIKQLMPLLPSDYAQMFTQKYHVRADYAAALTEQRKLAQKALEAFKLSPVLAPKIAGFMINKKAAAVSLTPQALVEQCSRNVPVGLSILDLEKLVVVSIEANPELVKKYQAGKVSVLGALIGDVMKRSKGQADPKLLSNLMIKDLCLNQSS